jgi:hypothetical protein
MTRQQIHQAVTATSNQLHPQGSQIWEKAKSKLTPTAATVILDKDLDGEDFDKSFCYRAVIGKLNFLEKSARPDIAYMVDQGARFAAKLKASHRKAICTLCRYSAGTEDKGLVYVPDP